MTNFSPFAAVISIAMNVWLFSTLARIEITNSGAQNGSRYDAIPVSNSLYVDTIWCEISSDDVSRLPTAIVKLQAPSFYNNSYLACHVKQGGKHIGQVWILAQGILERKGVRILVARYKAPPPMIYPMRPTY